MGVKVMVALSIGFPFTFSLICSRLGRQSVGLGIVSLARRERHASFLPWRDNRWLRGMCFVETLAGQRPVFALVIAIAGSVKISLRSEEPIR